ncbi:hypothetical protein GCM10023201_09870 [Actinomycetospora corticicola]|uniref:DUF4386 family protein n=1 Tax=Actinomycetospora corticicola TaxID=663602 RepID=A0A7Y9DTE3_9PSEU|nr:hypothetical protein [Actinomycetospora corticicola]NYD35176.1 hypothetical protein [Actinomycetospora corticicola]
MTTLDAPTTTFAATPAVAPRRRAMTSAGGIALLASPLLLAGGMVTIPPGEDGTTAGYVASLAATPWLTALSAGLLHYSWVLFALGILAVPALVRGSRGRGVVGVAAVAMSFCAIQISGLLLGDWHAMAAGRAVGAQQGAAIFEAAGSDLWMSTWLYSGKLVGFLGVALVVAALAYARAASWWLLALPVAGTASMVVLPGLLGTAGLAVGVLLSFGPLFVIGAQLVRQR